MIKQNNPDKYFSQITILIPTLNRYNHLRRLLKYFVSSGSYPKILVADSSSIEMDNGLEIIINNPDITYLRFPSAIDLTSKLSQALDNVVTEYVVICGDDDFLALSAVRDAVAFMQINLDYSVICGLTFHYQINPDLNDFYWWTSYRYTPVNFKDPSERLQWHLKNYQFPTFYGVQRINLLRRLFQETIETTSHYGMMEIVLSALNAINGKIGVLPFFYSLRQAGDPTGSKQDNNLRSWEYFFENESFRDQEKKALDLLSKNLEFKCHLSSEETKSIIRNLMEGYFNSCKKRKQSQSAAGLKHYIVLCLEKINLKVFARDIYIRINDLINRGPNELNISDCLKKDKNYTNNIALIRKAIF